MKAHSTSCKVHSLLILYLKHSNILRSESGNIFFDLCRLALDLNWSITSSDTTFTRPFTQCGIPRPVSTGKTRLASGKSGEKVELRLGCRN